MRHLISPLDFSVEETNQLIALAEDIAKDPKKYSKVCDGKKLLHYSTSQVPGHV